MHVVLVQCRCMLVAVTWNLAGRQEKKLLVELFQTCGKVELAFVIRSGLYFGFLLGILQMAVWVCWDPWWSLAVGGALVGYVTNFIAIKSVRSLPLSFWPVVCAQQHGCIGGGVVRLWCGGKCSAQSNMAAMQNVLRVLCEKLTKEGLLQIFEPVEPVRVGPWRFQGLFLTRQHEVAAEFALFLREKVLTPQAIWEEILYGSRKDKFEALLRDHIRSFAGPLASSQVRCRAPSSVVPSAVLSCLPPCPPVSAPPPVMLSRLCSPLLLSWRLPGSSRVTQLAWMSCVLERFSRKKPRRGLRWRKYSPTKSLHFYARYFWPSQTGMEDGFACLVCKKTQKL